MDHHTLNDRAQACDSDPSPERKRRVGRPRAGAWGSDKRHTFARGDVGARLRRLRAMSLIEVGVSVLALTAVISLLLPALGEGRRQGKEVRCVANLGQIGRASATYAASDMNELLTPIHPLLMIGSFVGTYGWGGKSGIGEPVSGIDPTSSRWGTSEGMGPATRPLNRVIYGDVFPDHQNDPGISQTNWLDDTQLDLDVFHCPADAGYTGHHLISWRDGKLTSFDHYGTSYAVSQSWIGVAGAACTLQSNSSFARPASRIPAPARTILYLENCGRYGFRRNYGIDGCSCLSGCGDIPQAPIRGWHGQDFVFSVAFSDGHVSPTFIDGHLHPQPNIGRYPDISGSPTSYSFWRCVIIRGDDWQIDTLPAPPVGSGIPCAGGGVLVNPIG